MTDHLDILQQRRIAYNMTEGAGPGVIFLGGFRSDMTGTKAIALEDWAKSQGRAFLRFDYSGHGESSCAFEAGAIGDWLEDAAAMLEMTEGPQILVGSSMGGWISLLLSKLRPERIAGLVLIAAAPDFTEDGFWAGFPEPVREQLMDSGKVLVPSDYGEPYVITKRLIEEGRNHLVLRAPLELPFPVRMLQGTEDQAVPVETALRLMRHATCDDLRLTLSKGSDHRFSESKEIAMILRAVEDLS